MDKVVIGTIVVTVLLLGGLVWLSSSDPSQLDPVGTAVANQGRNHISEGQPHEPYTSNPPTSGPHLAEAALEQIYDSPILDEAAVHALEHGRIWVSYHPDRVDEATRSELERVVRPFLAKALLSPRSGNDHAIAAAAWGYLQTWDEWTEQTRDELKLFLERNRDRGPERVP